MVKGQKRDTLTALQKHSSKTPHSKQPVNFPLPFPTDLKYPKHSFLRNEPPFENAFHQALQTSYEGFCVDEPNVMENEHSRVESALVTLERAGYFRVDVTQPFGLGTKCAKTYVTRCLLGEPGTTYKYLGLRMFSHSWNVPQSASSSLTQEQHALHTICDLNKALIRRTKHHIMELNKKRAARGAEAACGRLGFDVALINRMESTVGLKDEPAFGKGKCSVSWHADSSLEHFSNIAVYHLIDKEEDAQGNWVMGLRVAHNSEGPQASRRGTDITVETKTPPIAVSLPSGSTYYMLDDFNHHHQHAVIADGRAPGRRFSSTHRLLRDSHNVNHILGRCKAVCTQFHKKGPKVWRSEQLLLTELESEWLRQFFIQGQGHYNLHWNEYWGEPITELLKYWSQLEERTKQSIDWLQLGAEGRCGLDMMTDIENGVPPPRAERKLREKRRKAKEGIEELLRRGDVKTEPMKDCYDPLACLLEERAIMREMWLSREQDGVFHELRRDCRPIPLPVDFSVVGMIKTKDRGQSPLPGSPLELRDIAAKLRCWGKAYESGNKCDLPASASIAPRSINENDKPMDWIGWSSNVFGLEMQNPWGKYLLKGEKKIETRAYDLPPALIGKKIFILQSPEGTAGISSLGDTIDFSAGLVEQVGWCRFDRVISYRDQDTFEADKGLHLVEKGSGYGWVPDVTKVIYGWVVGEYGETTQSRDGVVPDKAIRRLRSIFELTSANEDKREELQSNPRPQSQRHRRKRRKRT